VEQSTNYDRLVLDIETDSSLTPRDALASAGATLKALVELVEQMTDEPEGLTLTEAATALLTQAIYWIRQIDWLTHRFPEGVYADVPGLCKIASRADIEAADWSLTPGRYVGVAPAEVDEDFDFGQAMRDIHLELKDLDREASELAAKIQANFEGLGI
jgi:type I restriction-modification system DNA methylase subunit